MSNKQELNQIFSDILGVNIILNENPDGYDKSIFVDIIEKWEKAWLIKNELIDKYGILFEGFDNLLFDALENMTSLLYGKNKSEVIQWYIYEGKDEDGEPYTLTNPETGKSYTLKNANDLYEFIQFEFNIDNLPDVDDEEN